MPPPIHSVCIELYSRPLQVFFYYLFLRVPHLKLIKSQWTEKLPSMTLLSSQFRTHDRHLIIDHFSRETLSFYEPRKDVLHLIFSPARSAHTVGLVSGAELCKQFIHAGRRCGCTRALGPRLLQAHTRESVSSVSFILFVSCLFLWYVTRLCTLWEAADSFSG